ncbi:MAG: type II toxin-antitoxin system VapC family toxin [Salinibacterium sp.]|nr:type II toxin-antitoxin system VapC family toxin [Salinibacterium sp.]
MMENALLLDSSIAAHALGADGPYKDACRLLLQRTAEAKVRAYASVEMIQELVHHRMRITGDRRLAAMDGRDISAAATLLAFDRGVLDLSLDLIERFPTVRGRDAVHAATAIAYGIERIASTDRAFDDIPGVTRVDPLTFG